MKLRISNFWQVALLLAIVPAVLITLPTPRVQAATSDCSDVYTPLSTSVVNGVNQNKSFYIQAMNETGVPWEMLAAIHYRETNFSHTNPSNGQGIFQFVNGDGGPYPAGPVSDAEFMRQLKFMANRIQSDYVFRNSPNPASVQTRRLVANEQDINLVKNTLFSYNGRATVYATQAQQLGYSQPYEGSPYVMNRFDCPRARMGIITKDYGTMDGTDTRYGTFTLFARLRGDDYWRLLTVPYSWNLYSQEAYYDAARTIPLSSSSLRPGQTIYMRVLARNFGNTTWTNSGANPIVLGTSSPGDRNSPFCDSSWLSCNRAALMKESSVAPGQIATFEFSMTSPGGYGNYTEYFNLIAEGKAWMNNFGMHWPLSVVPPTFQWSPESQNVFYDSSRTSGVNTDIMSPNKTYYVSLRARNTGNTIWTNSGANPVRLGTSNPIDRNSSFCDSSWLSCNRAATLKEASVGPGEIGTFEFSVKTPGDMRAFYEYFRPVVEGKQWMNDVGLYWSFVTRPPTHQWQSTGQAVYSNSARTTEANIGAIENNSTLYVRLWARNTGNTIWTNSGANPVRLGTSNPIDRNSSFCDSSWLSCNRAATLKEASVGPGEIGTFEFSVKTPYLVDGTFSREYFRPVAEGAAWLNDIGQYFAFTSKTSENNWSWISQANYSDTSRQNYIDATNLETNKTYYFQMKLRNTSGLVWRNSGANPLNLGTSNPIDRNSSFCDSSWLSCNRAATLKEASVGPGEIGTFEFSVKTPAQPITTSEYFRPLLEGARWLTDAGVHWSISTH